MTATNRIPLIGLLLVQVAIGYEWTMSGLTKIVRGDFSGGLADELRERSEGASDWYRSFLESVVIPNASGWGYAIEIGELLVGLVLIVSALVWLLGWERMRPRDRGFVLALTALAALAGVAMNVGFHLANGSAHPWLIPEDGFDEGVDLDSLMPAIQLVIAGVSGRQWWLGRGVRQQGASPPGRPPSRA